MLVSIVVALSTALTGFYIGWLCAIKVCLRRLFAESARLAASQQDFHREVREAMAKKAGA